jgi:ATP-dependent protease HslVU (ClpYQ) peptidase subunit
VTLILAMTDAVNDRAILCTDSGQWNGSMVSRARRPKFWGTKPWVVAMAGTSGIINTVRRIETPLATSDEAVEDYAGLVLRAAGAWQTEVSKFDSEPDKFSMVIAAGGRVFHCGTDCGISSPVSGVIARGMGNEFAMGAALTMMREVTTDVLRVGEGVMRLAAEHTDGCRPPFRWMATDGAEGTWT